MPKWYQSKNNLSYLPGNVRRWRYHGDFGELKMVKCTKLFVFRQKKGVIQSKDKETEEFVLVPVDVQFHTLF